MDTFLQQPTTAGIDATNCNLKFKAKHCVFAELELAAGKELWYVDVDNRRQFEGEERVQRDGRSLKTCDNA